MSVLAFTVPGRPMTWQRGVKGHGPRVKAANAYRDHVRLFALQAMQRLKVVGVSWALDGAFRVDVGGRWPDAREGDEDRLVNLVRDALEGVAYRTDRQVKAGSGVLAPHGADARIVVRVRTISDRERAELFNALAFSVVS